MKIINSLAPVVMGAIFVSCGASPTDSSSSGKRRLSANPIKLTKQIDVCDTEFGTFDSDTDIHFKINQFIGGSFVNRNILFKDMLSGNYVESRNDSPITDTYFGEETIYQVHAIYDESSEVYRVKAGTREVNETLSSPKYLTVCPSTKRYNSNTFEDSGLSVNYAITKTYNKLLEADPAIKLAAVEVNIGPLKKVDIRLDGGPDAGKNEFRYKTDNASYNPRDLTITFLPQSMEYQKSTKSKAPYWEIPMVASHEYGHHVFTTLFTMAIGSNLEVVDGCFHSGKIEGILDIENARGVERDNKVNFALRSMNEGYADLIAFYSLDEDERGLKGVPCFEKNREVSYPSFALGEPKVFGQKALDFINAETYKGSRETCNQPDFQEIHDVGAVFAHQVDIILNTFTVDKAVKLKIVLKWLESLAQNASVIDDLGAGETFFHALELMHKEAYEVVSGSRAPVCSDMDSSVAKGNYTCRVLK
jgi:hypothetical protein